MMKAAAGNRGRPGWRSLLPVSCLTVVGALLLFSGRALPVVAAAGTAANTAIRDVQRARVLVELRGWPHRTVPRLTVYYAPGLARDARVVASAAETYWPEVMRDYGLGASTPRAVLVVVTPSQMTRFVGGASTDPPLGAYYQGVDWLLAPSAFLPSGSRLTAAYAQSGPVAHELTHMADALLSGGRTPRWLDEGLAQYEDWRLTGYVWVQAGNGFNGGVYSWAALTQHFDNLPDMALAYRQALAATAAICRTGAGTCTRILAELRAGEPVEQALQRAVGSIRLRALQTGAAWQPGEAPQPGTPAGPRP